MQIVNCEQGTEEWFMARLGVPTASKTNDIMVGGKGLTRKTYMRKLAGEAITGEIQDGYSNEHMLRGTELEPVVIELYESQMDVKTEEVGLILTDFHGHRFGASPDRLVGDDGLLEVKTRLPHLQIEVLEKGKIPSSNLRQIQAQLIVSERKWCDFVSYCPGLPMFIHRYYSDEFDHNEIIEPVIKFSQELEQLIELITAKF